MALDRNHPVTVQDAQALGYCVRGLRRGWNSFPEKQINGVSFEQFIHEGVTLGWLLDVGHPYADALAQHIIEKGSSNGQQRR